MALSDDIALFSRVPLFKGMGEDRLRLIAFGAERRRLSEGQVLFHEHAPADCGFVVASGRLALTTGAGNEPERIADAACLLSELAMISAVERKFTATALEDTEVIRINRPLFRRMLEEYPEIAAIVDARVRENLQAMIGRVEALSRRFA